MSQEKAAVAGSIVVRTPLRHLSMYEAEEEEHLLCTNQQQALRSIA